MTPTTPCPCGFRYPSDRPYCPICNPGPDTYIYVSYEDTAALRTSIRQAVHNHGGTIHATAKGAAIWEGEGEFFHQIQAVLPASALPQLRQRLSTIALLHSQDAIACVEATPDSLCYAPAPEKTS